MEQNDTGNKNQTDISSSSGISENIRNIENSLSLLKSEVPTKSELAQLQQQMTTGGKETSLVSIDRQRRGWEEAKEKAEEMSQIFDSLIITNDRPYVSCGLSAPAECPGLLEFASFDLINKLSWDPEIAMMTVTEPGVYLLQLGGTLTSGHLLVKLVTDEVEAEVMMVEGGPDKAFHCRSTIFTVEDDDQTAEQLLVELVEFEEEVDPRVEKDLSFLLYKISEVSTAEV